MYIIRIIPFLILFSLASCKRSGEPGTGSTKDLVPPLIVRTALADTLPARAIQRLHLENIQGIKVKYATGPGCEIKYADVNKSGGGDEKDQTV